jgi:hypothetical protein
LHEYIIVTAVPGYSQSMFHIFVEYADAPDADAVTRS